MADRSPIEWTDATWNPVTGCSVVSPGCTNCYAMKLAGTRLKHIPSRAGLTRNTRAGPVWTGEVRFNESMLDQPLRWARPRKIFVCAHGDLFAEGVPDEWIDRVFAVMALSPHHTFQVLTKRPDRMRGYLSMARAAPVGMEAMELTLLAMQANPKSMVGAGIMLQGDIAHLQVWPLPNVWLGVSAEDQTRADQRIPDLLATPAAVRFVSVEPLLGPIHLDDFLNGPNPISRGHEKLDWVIVGGESGQDARPMQPDWARALRDQCAAAGTAFFFKQWGEYLPVGQSLPGHGKVHGATAVAPGRMKLHYAGTPRQAPQHAFAERGVEFTSTADGLLAFRLGKQRAGRLLDGVEHNGWPG